MHPCGTVPLATDNHTCPRFGETQPFGQIPFNVGSVARLLLKARQPRVVNKYYVLLCWKLLEEAIAVTCSSITGAKSLGYDGGLGARGGEGGGVLLTSRAE